MSNLWPDLGKYAGTVLGGYGATFAILGALIAVSLWRGARARRRLAALEAARSTQLGARQDG